MGHEEAVKRSYEMVLPTGKETGSSIEYVWETGQLFLKTKEALDKNQAIRIFLFQK